MASWLCIRLLDDLKKPLFPQQICVSLICTNDAIIANIKKDPPSKKKTQQKKTTTKTKPKQKKKLPKNKTKDLPPAHEKIPNKTKRKQPNIQKQTKQRWLFFFSLNIWLCQKDKRVLFINLGISINIHASHT